MPAGEKRVIIELSYRQTSEILRLVNDERDYHDERVDVSGYCSHCSTVPCNWRIIAEVMEGVMKREEEHRDPPLLESIPLYLADCTIIGGQGAIMPSMYASGHPDKNVETIIFILDGWVKAMDDGSVAQRYPSSSYKRKSGKPEWTEGELDLIMRSLDYEIDQEVARAPGTSTGSKMGPGFVRMDYNQRLAMVQELDEAIARLEFTGEPVTTGVVSPEYVTPVFYDNLPDTSYYVPEVNVPETSVEERTDVSPVDTASTNDSEC